MALRWGNGSSELLNGTSFVDLMFGNGGNDTLVGGFLADVLTGGSGNDSFKYLSVTDSTWWSPDVITDFKQGKDVIDLSCLLGPTDLALDYSNTPIANGAWTTKLNVLGVKTTIVKVDVTGDGSADMHIVLNGWFDLNKKDFVGVNNGPDAIDDSAGKVCENGPGICIDVLGNDTDPDGIYDSLSLKEVAGTATVVFSADGDPDDPNNDALLTAIAADTAQLAGLFSKNGDKIDFDPGNTFDALLPGQIATITIEYTVEDESGATDTATLTVEVEGKRDTADDRWIVSDFALGFSVGDWAVLANDNTTTPQTINSVNESLFFFSYDGDFDFGIGYNVPNNNESFKYTTSLGETATVTIDEVGSNLAFGNTIDISGEDYDFAHLDGLGGNDTLIGGAARDQLVGGLGSDVLRGGGGDDTMTGGTDLLPPADTFQLVAPTANGTDVITDFDSHAVVIVSITYDRIAFQQGADGWDAAGSNPGSGSTSGLAASAYQNRNAIADIAAGDTNKVVELQGAATSAGIAAGTGAAANAYVVLFNSDTGRGEIWWDANWSTTADRYQVATIDNIDSLGELTYLNRFDFAEWQL